MAGVLSTLGMGSQGALSYDIIDKLKKNDETLVVKPIEKKIDTLTMKKKSIDTLMGMVGSLKSDVGDLSSIYFLNKSKTDISGSSVAVKVEPGARVKEMKIDVSQLATRQIQQTKQFSSKSDHIASQNDTLHFQVGTASFDIDVDQNTTLQDLTDLLNTKSNGSIKASILNTGGDTPYRLILSSAQTGTKHNITMSDDNGTLSDLNVSVVQSAQDAQFSYNGVSITRGTNTIDDLFPGVELTLKEKGSSQVTIKNDTEKIGKKIQDFVDKYNTLIDSIQTMTKYDAENRTAGVLQGVSEINTLKSRIRNALEGSIGGKSLADVGIQIDRYGKMSFDDSKFTEFVSKDPQAMIDLFSGDTLNEKIEDDGVFSRLKEAIKEVATGHNSTFKHLLNDYDAKMKRLETNKENAKKRLDIRYEIMAKKFASFDNLIGRMNNQFSSLDMIIQSQLNQKK